jgi:hypothetical protein
MIKTTLLTTSLMFIAFASSVPSVQAASVCENQEAQLTPSFVPISCTDIQCVGGSDGLGILMMQSLPGGIAGSMYCLNSVGQATCYGVIYCSDTDMRHINDDEAECRGYGSSGFLGIMLVYLMCYNIPCSESCVGSAAATSSQPRAFDLANLEVGALPQIGDVICSPVAGCAAVLPNSASMLLGEKQQSSAFACNQTQCRIVPVNCAYADDSFDCSIGGLGQRAPTPASIVEAVTTEVPAKEDALEVDLVPLDEALGASDF